MDYCYILFVRSGIEERVHQLLSERLDANTFMPFVPKKAMVFKRSSVLKKIHKKCFPGYVFIQSSLPPTEFIRRVFPVVYQVKEAYRFLHYGDNRQDIALRENERRALMRLFGEEFTIDCLVGVMEGDRIQIVNGAFFGAEGTVKKIIPRKREVIVEIPFMGDLRQVTLGLDIIGKV